MEIPNFIKRCYVKITCFKPPVFKGEEKQKIINKMINDNRNLNHDIKNNSYSEGLLIEEIKLNNCLSFLIKKDNNPTDKIIYYIHGGGFTGACTRDRMEFVSYLVKEFGYNVYSIDYRLAPEFKYPCQINDCLDGYKWLLKRYKSNNIVFIGESAGANLVVVLSILLRDKNYPLPSGVYANSIVSQFDGYTSSYERCSLKTDFIVVKGILENFEDIYYTKDEKRDPYIAPLHADLNNLPPIWLTVSKSECLLDDSRMLYQKLIEQDNKTILKEYDNLCHAFIISSHMRNVVKKTYGDLKNFLNIYLNKEDRLNER